MSKRFLVILAIGTLYPLGAWALQHEPSGGHGMAEHPALEATPEHGLHESISGHEAGGEHGHGPAAINWTDFSNHHQPPFAASFVNFALLLAIYYYFGKGPVAAGLQSRRDSIAKEIEEAQRMRKEAEARAKQYQAKLDKLDEEIDLTRKSLAEAGRVEKERLVREAEEKAQRLQRDVEFLLEQEVKQMRQDVTRETVEAAIQAAEDLLRKRVTPADQDRLADEFLAELTRRPTKAPGRGPGSGPTTDPGLGGGA